MSALTPAGGVARADLVETEGVTLDGRPARILGSKLDYAVVRDSEGRSHEWAWPTVERIVRLHDGAFHS